MSDCAGMFPSSFFPQNTCSIMWLFESFIKQSYPEMNIYYGSNKCPLQTTIIYTYWKHQSAQDHEFCYFMKKS